MLLGLNAWGVTWCLILFTDSSDKSAVLTRHQIAPRGSFVFQLGMSCVTSFEEEIHLMRRDTQSLISYESDRFMTILNTTQNLKCTEDQRLVRYTLA